MAAAAAATPRAPPPHARSRHQPPPAHRSANGGRAARTQNTVGHGCGGGRGGGGGDSSGDSVDGGTGSGCDGQRHAETAAPTTNRDARIAANTPDAQAVASRVGSVAMEKRERRRSEGC